ncbi:glutathione S-transferase family protein [Nitratireductor sp. ZSWI3]|uniref:glutathione S-transferase family protein n=1 Tax=Nitratireductor sp. ZSWI3 TaxID=2966359 RepID=UPI00214F666C|nr:glutathione S-transferase family protein [Nitratireductor sp. ZSWI3]MCR4268210.1 glutathione S-transferase family protein [Nitratireductor sp. ZSWI3]
MAEKPTLISFDLCPYVQRAAIVLAEKDVPFERIDIDLENKPDWFLEISPRGKVPVLKVGDDALFESAAIVEFLDETEAPRLHPENPVTRARHRAWMEFGSAVLADIWTLETTHDQAAFDKAVAAIREKLTRLEGELGDGPYFAGEAFTIVDAVFAPAFRYFDVFDTIADFGVFDGLPKVVKWRKALAARPTVREAVVFDYGDRLRRFLAKKDGVILRQPRKAA